MPASLRPGRLPCRLARQATLLVLALTFIVAIVPPVPVPTAESALAATRLDWGSKPPMPQDRADLAVAMASNGRLYAAGGSRNNVALDTLEEYDPSTSTWIAKARMRSPRVQFGMAAASNGKLYAVGGLSFSTPLPTVEEYDPATNVWTNCGTPAPGNACQSMPTSRHRLGLAAAPNGKLYAVGGLTATPVTDRVEEYDPATNVWTNCGTPAPGNACQPMPTAREQLGLAAAPNGKLYAVGGVDAGFNFTATVQEYDPATNTWTNCGTPAPGNACPQMPTARRDLGLAAAPNGKLYAVGGLTATSVTDRVQEYDPATNVWTNCGTPAPGNACATMPTARQTLGLVLAPNGRLYAVGGATSGFIASNKVEEYDPAGNTWAAPPAVQDLPGPRQFAASAAANGKVYVFGGLDESTTPRNTAFEYSPNGSGPGSWRAIATMSFARQGAAAVLGNDGKVYVVGGRGSGGVALASVEVLTLPANGSDPGGFALGPPLNTARSGHGLAKANDGRIYAVGGFDTGFTPLGSVEELAFNGSTALPWRNTLTAMPTPRSGLGLATAGDGRIFAVGGLTGNDSTALTAVEAFTPPVNTSLAGSWASVASNTVAQLPGKRWALGIVTGPDGHLYVVGGTNESAQPVAQDLEYDPTLGAQGAWSSTAGQPIRASQPTTRTRIALVLSGSNLYAIGGFDGGATVLARVERAVLTRIPSASAGGPYTVKRGQAVQLQGSGSDPDSDPLTFAWNIGGLLHFNVAGQSPNRTIDLPNGTYPVQVRALDNQGAYGVSSRTTLTVICGPRPNVQVQTTRLGPGQIRATLTAGQGSLTSPLSLGVAGRPIVNARVNVEGGPQNITASTAVPVSGTQVVLTVTRINPGAVTVPLSLGDTCGSWNSFVGFGTGV